jgi:hypothetical protein
MKSLMAVAYAERPYSVARTFVELVNAYFSEA